LGSDQDTQSGPWPEVRQWAEGAGHRFAPSRGGEGFVVESPSGATECRVEWGPSQRNYIVGQELRVRIGAGRSAGLQMLVATRELMRRLEHEVFEQFTDGNETRIDDETPEEMRWVVLYSQAPASVLGPLHTRFGLLSNRPQASVLWLKEGLADPLADSLGWHDPAAPMVLVVQRGRCTLRLALPEPRIAVLDGALALGRAAAAAALRVSEATSHGLPSSQQPSTWGATPDTPARAAKVDH
jgi:hypothetical protein